MSGPLGEPALPQGARVAQEIRALLVEDSADDAELVLRELRKAGLAVTALRVTTRGALVRALNDFAPDVVLSDYRLPTFDGRAALEMVRAHSQELPLIIVSGTLGDVDAVELIKLGATDFVLKDRMSRLGPAVGRALREAEDGRRRLRTEAALQLRGTELKRSYSDLERFAHIAAHDLQEPLRAVMSCTQLLARRYAGKGEQGADEFVDYVRQAVGRMRDTIEELREYVSISSGQPAAETTDLTHVLAAALTGLAERIKRTRATVTHGPLPALRVSGAQIARLFQAVVENALDRAGDPPPHVHVSAERGGSVWTFSVRDDCASVDPVAAEKIFVLLQCGQRAGDAAGFTSLPVSRRIVEAHGGRIWVEPAAGGSVFRFTLPAETDDAAASNELPMTQVRA